MPVITSRKHKRGFKDYQIKFGLREPEHSAKAKRLSVSGLFIDTNKTVFSPGVALVMEIQIGGGVFRVGGIVRHSRKVDPRLLRVLHPGMGIEFTEASENLKAAIIAGEKVVKGDEGEK